MKFETKLHNSDTYLYDIDVEPNQILIRYMYIVAQHKRIENFCDVISLL